MMGVFAAIRLEAFHVMAALHQRNIEAVLQDQQAFFHV
jgi:hypothetical protein